MKGEIGKVKKTTRQVEGWLLEPEGELLYELAKRCTGRGVIVEIGSWKGKSTIWLGRGSEQGKAVKVYATDPHRGSWEHKTYGTPWSFDEFRKNMQAAGVEDIVVPIVKGSEEAVKSFKKPVELIFIDGEHEYRGVKSDFQLWFPKVIDGGIMVFHDTTKWPGPKRLVEESVYKSHSFNNIGLVGTTTFAMKVGKNSVVDRLRNRFLLLLKVLSELADKLLPKSMERMGMRLAKFIQVSKI